ncbi:MAG: hypothetical protein RL235_887 [Chlamydiota bacterium]|jgi:thiol peroxidase
MSQTKLKGSPVHLHGQLPALHMHAPAFTLVDKDLKDKTLHDFAGKAKIITTVPSLDTGLCSIMTKHFNEAAKKHPGGVILVVSADLPFASKRFCEAEHVHNVHTLSMMRSKEFGKAYGILIEDGPLAGLLARSVWVLDTKDRIVHVELVAEITEEPNYHKAIAAWESVLHHRA